MFGRRQAPNIDIMDHVMTPDGPGYVVDSSQNRDGHYVWFKVHLEDGPFAGETNTFHLKDLRPINKQGKATAYLNDAPNRIGQYIDKKA